MQPSDDAYRELARFGYVDGDDIQVDANALVSRPDNGAWIQCWRWVYIPETEGE